MLTRAEIIRIVNKIDTGDEELHGLNPHEFEAVASFLLDPSGIRCSDWVLARDSGVDFIAEFNAHAGTVAGAIECKLLSPERPVDSSVVKSFLLAIQRLNVDMGLLITSSSFTANARKFCMNCRPDIELVDGETLRARISEVLRSEEERGADMARRIGSLHLKEFQRLESLDMVNMVSPESVARLALPTEYQKRILAVENLPFRLVRQIASDARHMRTLTPRQFEEFTAELLDALGFRDIVLTPRQGDGGRDVIASHIFNGIPITYYFECKKYADDNKIQLDSLRALLGVVAHNATQANIGVLVTTSTFTRGCEELILSEARLDGKDYYGILDWLQDFSKLYPPTR